jgi:hypothetical protein
MVAPTGCLLRSSLSRDALVAMGHEPKDTVGGEIQIAISRYQSLAFARELNAGMVHVNGTTIQEEAHVRFGSTARADSGEKGARSVSTH